MMGHSDLVFLQDALPFWDKITEEEKLLLKSVTTSRFYKEGESLHDGSADCVGLLLVKSGQIRVYIVSESGKEITLYRLFERDICIFSASCLMKNISFDVHVQAEKDSGVIVIPASAYEKLNKSSLPVSDYTNQLMSSRFSDVMWVMEQILFMSFDQRLALFLLEQSLIDDTKMLTITHETIAKHLGSAREVVTRMLKYFQSEGMVSLSRGGIQILNADRLRKLAEAEKR